MNVCKSVRWVLNSVYPDQTPRYVASDVGLGCLLRSVYPNMWSKCGNLIKSNRFRNHPGSIPAVTKRPRYRMNTHTQARTRTKMKRSRARHTTLGPIRGAFVGTVQLVQTRYSHHRHIYKMAIKRFVGQIHLYTIAITWMLVNELVTPNSNGHWKSTTSKNL